MRELAHDIESTIPLPAVRAALCIKTNRTLKAICARHGIPIVTFSPGSKALRRSSYDLLLQRATEDYA